MQDRIGNIDFEPSTSRESRWIKKDDKYSGNVKKNSSVKDSLNISSYSGFISKLGWKMGGVTYRPPRIVTIKFSTQQLDFDFEVDIDKFLSTGYHYYKVTKTDEKAKTKLILFFTIIKKNIKSFDIIESKKIPFISQLVQKVSHMEFNNEIHIFTSEKLLNLFEEYEHGVEKEFDYLDFVVFKLLQLFGEKINFTNETISEKLILEKVKIGII